MLKQQERFMRLKQMGGKAYKSLHAKFNLACAFYPLLPSLVLSCPLLSSLVLTWL